MFAKAVVAVWRRELAYLRAHPWDLALVSWVPALAMALAWAIFAQGVNVRLPIAVVDQDHSPASRRLLVTLDAVRSVAIAQRPTDLEAAWPLVRERRVYAVLQIPPDWERRGRRGDPLPVVLYTNEQYQAASKSMTNDIVGALADTEIAAGVRKLALLGGGLDGAERRIGAVRAELRTLYNPQLSFELTLAGTFLPHILHIFVLAGAAYALGREYRDHTAGQWLAAANGSIVAAVAGKLLPLLAWATLLGLGILAWCAGYRGWPVNGSLLVWWCGLETLLFACCAVPSLFIGLTGTLRVALAALAIANITAVSFTGFTYPLYSMPTAAKVWSAMLPFSYFYQIQQQQWNLGAPVAVSVVPLTVLWGVFIIVPLAIALPLLAKRCRAPQGWGKR